MNIIQSTGLSLAAFLFSACTGGNKLSENKQDILKIDVTQSYPKKKLVLQDIAEIRYIPVETSDEFLCATSPRVLTKDKIIFSDNKLGDILIFDSEGKAVSKFNRKGGSGEEYNYLFHTLYDDKTGEIYVGGDPSKIRVYTTDGKYLRTLSFKENKFIDHMLLFDKDNLLCYAGNDSVPAFTISRKDGSVTGEIAIPFEKKISEYIERNDGENFSVVSTATNFVRENKDGFFISAVSSDTIYQLTPGEDLVPVVVRNPSVQTMEAPVFVEYGPETGRYTFLTTIKREFDWDTRRGFPRAFLFLDKESGEFFEQDIVNVDFEGQSLTINDFFSRCKAGADTGVLYLQTDMLMDAYENEKLSGKLKEIAAGLKDDDNGVVMVLTFK